MKILFQRWSKQLSPYFLDEKNEASLVSMLNAFTQMESPLVSATFHNLAGVAVVERENSTIYIATCENADGNTVEISLVFGMDYSMEPFLLKTFMNMIQTNKTESLTGRDKTYYMTIQFQEEARDQGEGYKVVLAMENKDRPGEANFITSQKMMIYSMEKFVFRNPMSPEELWMLFLSDPKSKLLKEHPSLPEWVGRAVEYGKTLA